MRRIGGVDDVEQQVGVGGLVERRAERRDEIVRQLLDEADGVGDEDRRLGRRHEPADRRVERREQLVGDVDVAAGQRAHQRRLAGVRVADERDRRQLAAALAPRLARRPRCATSSSLELGDAIADAPAIELERALAGALAADAAAHAIAAAARPRAAAARGSAGARSRPAGAPRGSSRGDGRSRG